MRDRVYLTLTNARWIGHADIAHLDMGKDWAYSYGGNILGEPTTNYMFAKLINDFGILAGILAAVLLGAVLVYGFSRLSRIHNHYGKLMSFSALTLLGGQGVFHILVNLGFAPDFGSMMLPFFSNSGSNMLFSILLIGVLLAVWRRNQILTEVAYLEPEQKHDGLRLKQVISRKDGKLIIDYQALRPKQK